jgi:hypothetical protein
MLAASGTAWQTIKRRYPERQGNGSKRGVARPLVGANEEVKIDIFTDTLGYMRVAAVYWIPSTTCSKSVNRNDSQAIKPLIESTT